MELKIAATENFEGSVTIKLPEMPETFRFKAKYGRLLIGKESDNFDKLEMIANIAEEIRTKFMKVELVEKKTQRKIESVDDLYSYEPCFEVISDIGLKFIQGFAEKNS